MESKLRFTLVSLLMMLCGTAFAGWQKTETLTVGDVVIMAGETQSATKELTAVTTSGTTIGTATDYTGTPAGTYPLTIVAGSTEGSIAFKTTADTYLSWSSGNSLTTAESVADASSWTVAYSNGFTVTNVGTTARILQYNAGSPRFACYGNSYQTKLTFWKQVEDSSVATPTFTPNGGTFVGTTSVEIACETEGATIYYSMNGADPVAGSSPQYGRALPITETTTVKAIAVKDNDKSAVASATFTRIPSYSSFTAMSSLANNDLFAYTGNAWVVAKPTDKYVYLYNPDERDFALIYDQTGEKSVAAEVGKYITPGWTGKVSIYRNLFELVPDNALTVTDDPAQPVNYPDIAIGNAVMNQVITLKDVTSYLVSGKSISVYVNGEDKELLEASGVKTYNQFSIEIAEAEVGKTYEIIGAIGRNNDQIQFWPIEIKEQVAETPEPELSFYIVGSMTNWNIDANYKMTLNEALVEKGIKEFSLTTTLTAGTEFKAVSSTDGMNPISWFPEPGGNYVIPEDGEYTIYFRPNYDGSDDWHYNVLYVSKEAEPIYIETDLTAQFNSLANTKWTGSSAQVGWAAPKVTTNSGLEVAAWERYNGSCDWTGEIMSSSVTGLTPGTYKIELYGAAAFTFGRGFGSTDFTGDFSKATSDTYQENDAITENTGVTLFAETSEGTVSREIPIWYATNFNTSGIATATLENVVVGDAGTIKIGLSKTSTSTNWHVVQLKGVTAQVDAVELHAKELAAAQAALNAEENAIVTGEEKTALETAIRENATVAEQTADAYKAAIKALSDATAAFTGAKAAYEEYAAAQAYLVDLPYADAAKKPAAEAATNAADATAKAETLLFDLRSYYESNALAEAVEGAQVMTDFIKNPNAQDGINYWTVVKGEGSGGNINVMNNEPWTDAAGVAEHKYFDGGNWGAQAWDVALEQKINLPAGKYQLTTIARASGDVDFTLYAGADSMKIAAIGAAGGMFNRGWNNASVEFEMAEADSIVIGVRGVTAEIHNWMSFSDFRLVQLEEGAEPAELEKFYIMGTGTPKDWTGTTEMTFNEETQAFEYTIEGESGAWITFADIDWTATDDGWDDFNANHRYAIGEGDYNVTVGEAMQLQKVNGTLTLAAGKYNISVTKDLLCTVNKVEEPVVATHTWDFTQWSNETVANLKAEAAKVEIEDEGEGRTILISDNGALWSDHEKASGKTCNTYAASKDNCFWQVETSATEGEELTANGQPIAELQGLLFKNNNTRLLAIAVNYPETSLGTYNGPSYLWLGSKNMEYFTIKNVKPGTTITMGVESHKPTDARGVRLFVNGTELNDPEGNAVEVPTTYTEQTWQVPAGEGVVDVVVKNTSGCHIYFIDAEIETEPVVIEPKTYTASFTTNYDWEDVYAYTWTYGESVVEQLGAWPGTKLEKDAATGLYNVTIESEEAPAYIIFNNGLGGGINQTADLVFEEGKLYEFNLPIDNNVVFIDGVRQAPDPETTAFTTGSQYDYYYLYNTSAKKFFTQGNTWGTRVCVGPYASAVKMYFADSDAYDGTYTIQNYVCMRSPSYSWKGVCGDYGSHSLYCDQSTSWGRPYWYVVPVEDNVFRLANTEPYFNDGDEYLADSIQLFMGRDDADAQDFSNAYAGFEDDGERYPVSDALTVGSGHHVDWALVTPDAYDAVADAWAIYEKSKELKATLDEAKEKNLDVAEAEAVYLNGASTIEQLEDANDLLKLIIKNAVANAASPENPADMTNCISNASYDNGSKDWSGTVPAIGYNAAEFFYKNFNMYQDLTGMPNGVYAVKVKGFYRPGSIVNAYAKWPTGKDLNAMLYATAGEDNMSVPLVNIFEGSTSEKLYVGTEYGENGNAEEGQEHYVPNNMQAADAYFNAGRYQNVVFNAVDDGTLRIGLMKDDSNFAMNWTMFDQWELVYYGNSAEAFKFWVNEAKKNVPDFSNLSGETIYTESYLATLNELVDYATATDRSEAVAAISAIDNVVATVEKNIALWENLQTVIAEAIEVGADETLDPAYTANLAEWAEFDAEDILYARELTNEDLETLIAEKSAAIEEARRHPVGVGVDMTNLLKNPDFQQEEKGWTGFRTQSSPLMPVMGGPADNRCAEAWNTASFDLYQVVENAPVGVYEISVQGFYRYGRGDNAWNIYNAQEVDEVRPGGAPCYVYMNAKATPFQNVFDEPVSVADDFYSTQRYNDPNGEFVYPDDMISAGEAYSRGMYTQRAYGLVAKEGDVMRIGVKGSSNQLNDSWVIFDNFKLTWLGYDANVVLPVLEEELAKAMLNVYETMGNTAYEHLSTAIANAETALQGTEGEVMFNALSALYDVDEEVNASVKVFKDLNTALELLNEELGIHSDSPAIEEAVGLMDEIMGNIGNHVYDNADVADLIAKINEIVNKLRIPVYNLDDITDLNPVDFTALINNASYDEDLNGWTCDATPLRNSDYGNVELFNCSYDYYQEISGLPEGIYRVQVTGFYRAGSAADEWNTGNRSRYSRAFIYAVGEDDKVSSKALTRLSENYFESSTIEYGYTAVKTDVIDQAAEIYNYTLLANTMYTAGDLFAQGYYSGDVITGEGNVVTVKVGADGKLRIGLKKSDVIDMDWTMFDDWRLWYFGPNSENQPNEDESLAEPDDEMKGDANDDRQVTMSDVVAIVNYVLGRVTASFNFFNADVNGNDEITMADVVGVVNMVLGRNVNGARMADNIGDMAPGTLSLSADADRMSIVLDNTAAYTAFQMDVTLPEGMSIDDVTFTGRATTSHVLSMNTLDNGKVRITGWSARNADLKGNSGELFTMNLSGLQMVGTVTVDNVLFVTANGKEHKLNGAEIFGETTGISQMENGQWIMDNSYDLQGRKVNSQKKKGLYIVNGKKSIIK